MGENLSQHMIAYRRLISLRISQGIVEEDIDIFASRDTDGLCYETVKRTLAL